MSLWLIFLLAAILLALAMTVAWDLSVRTGRSGWADTFWSYSVGVVGTGAALVPLAPGAWPQPRAMLVAALGAFWSFRLGTHILRRTLAGGDDPRYAELRRQWGESWRSRLLLFLQAQAAAGLVLVAAILAAAHAPGPLGLVDVAAALLALGAMAGEAVSDVQLRAFKADPRNQGQVCDTGLWSLSRHPNYFFEWLFWVGIALFGFGSLTTYPWGLAGLLAPLMMYVLLVHVSGIPPLEAHMARSRGDAFEAYRQRVPAFWPTGRRRPQHSSRLFQPSSRRR
jgi:steroid 5-alpha reductase family enzyme